MFPPLHILNHLLLSALQFLKRCPCPVTGMLIQEKQPLNCSYDVRSTYLIG